MPYINQIVDIINNKLSEHALRDDSRFIKKLYGLVELLKRNNENNEDTIPVLLDLNGNITFSGFNDLYSIIIYHRCLGLNTIDGPIMFGDGDNSMREEASMRCVVYANRLITRLQPTELAFVLSSGLQFQLKNSDIQKFTGLNGAVVEIGQTNFDSTALYSNEYKLATNNYNLQPTDCYFSIDYTITTDYDITCIDHCQPC